MPAERKPARDDRPVRRRPRIAPSPEENCDAAGGCCDIYNAAAIASGVSTGRDDVSAQEHREQAAEDDVGRLEVAVAAPQAPAHAGERGDREYQKYDKGRDSTQLVERQRGLQILGDPVVRHQRQNYMEHRGAEGHPTEHFVAAKRE